MIMNNEIKKIFGKKYYKKIMNYISVVQYVLDNYDVVIFMARKAYCFFKAVMDSGLIAINTEVDVFSSRAITYNQINFNRKRVAIIEDVVVQGKSLKEVLENDSIKNELIDIFILACSDNYLMQNTKLNIVSPFLILPEKELLEIATLITNYIVYKMVHTFIICSKVL